MEKLQILLFFFAFISTSLALKCYQCDSAKNPDCEKLENMEKVNVMECKNPTISSQKAACITKVMKAINEDIRNVTRRCITIGNKNTITGECDPITRYEVESCSFCTEDLCNAPNAASLANLSALLSLSLPVLYLIFKI